MAELVSIGASSVMRPPPFPRRANGPGPARQTHCDVVFCDAAPLVGCLFFLDGCSPRDWRMSPFPAPSGVSGRDPRQTRY